jgi:hypothetical protein
MREFVLCNGLILCKGAGAHPTIGYVHSLGRGDYFWDVFWDVFFFGFLAQQYGLIHFGWRGGFWDIFWDNKMAAGDRFLPAAQRGD